MAAKIRIMKLLQEIRGLADITNRRPQPRQPGLFLIQLRSHVLTGQPRRRHTIAVDVQDRPDIPHPVKITHLQGSPLPTVTVPRVVEQQARS